MASWILTSKYTVTLMLLLLMQKGHKDNASYFITVFIL